MTNIYIYSKNEHLSRVNISESWVFLTLPAVHWASIVSGHWVVREFFCLLNGISCEISDTKLIIDMMLELIMSMTNDKDEIRTMKMMSTLRLEEEQQLQLPPVEQQPAELQHPEQEMFTSLQSSYYQCLITPGCMQAWVGGCVQGRPWCRKPGGLHPAAA